MANGKYEAATNSGIVQLSDGQYDFFREVLEKGFPAAIAFYALVAGYLKWGNVLEVTGIMGGLAVFLGVILTLARKGYVPPREVPPGGYDGKVVEDVTNEGLPILRVELDPKATTDLMNKPQIVIKGYDAGA